MNVSASCLVVKTSPLFHLAKADLLHLLQEAAPIIWIPEPVAREIQAYGPKDATARALAANDWLEVRPAPPLSAQVLAWDLGPGESAVIELARSSSDSTAVIDD
jgi:predicted nucleic acid-binding protein